MVGIKARTIKELKDLGVRKAEKQGVGLVSLGHMKTADLINMLDRIKNKG